MQCVHRFLRTIGRRAFAVESSTHRHNHLVEIAYDVIGRFFLFNHHDLASLGGKYSLYILKAKSHETIAMFHYDRVRPGVAQ